MYVPEFSVVCASTGGVDEAPGDARDEELVGDDELDDRVERLFARGEHRVEFLGLWDCAREAVEYKPSARGSKIIRTDARLTEGKGGVGTHPFLHDLLFSS